MKKQSSEFDSLEIKGGKERGEGIFDNLFVKKTEGGREGDTKRRFFKRWIMSYTTYLDKVFLPPFVQQ